MPPADDQHEIAFARSVPPQIAYPETPEAYMGAVQMGLDDLAAGRVIPAERIWAWLESWGSENELPAPEPECE